MNDIQQLHENVQEIHETLKKIDEKLERRNITFLSYLEKKIVRFVKKMKKWKGMVIYG